MDTKVLDKQSQHWEKNFSNKPEMFGLEPSYSAKKSLEIFKKNKINNIIELGAGLGRDTIFFAENDINVHALDYSQSAINIIKDKVKKKQLQNKITAEVFDVRKKFQFSNNFFDSCYSHMLYCMALSNIDLIKLNQEILRIIKPGGFNIYTVRNTFDADFKKGISRGDDLYEIDGFIVHFFSDEKIKSLLDGYLNIELEKFDEGSFPRKLSLVINQKNN